MIVPPLGGRGFFGREPELSALHARRRALAQRRGSFVLVGGPAGIGKSRLIGEFWRATGGGRAPLMIRAECLQNGAQPFGPVREIVGALPSTTGGELDAVIESALDQGSLFTSIERSIVAASRKRAIVVVVEDLHWADPATADFFAHLAGHVANERLAVFATYRDDEIDGAPQASALARIARAASTHRMSLRSLDDATMLALLDAALPGGEKPPRKVLRDIVARAEGNPFFAEELLKAALEAPESPALPLSVNGTVLARFRALPANQRKVLAHAAVLGYRFDPDLLATILPLKAETIARGLRSGCEQHLLVEEPEARLRFRFRHALTHEAIAAQMLEFDARPLHARVASELEGSRDAERRVAEIAYHWWKAADERAVAANEAAAEEAIALHAYADAERHLGRALAFARDTGARARLFTRTALVTSFLGDQELSLSFYERALALELEAGHLGAASRTVRRVAGRLVYLAREPEAIERLARFHRAYASRLDEVDALLVEGWPLLIQLGGGGARTWREHLLRSESAATVTGQAQWELLLLEVLAHADVGAEAQWRDAVERLRARSERAGAADRAWSLMMIGMTAAYLGADETFARGALDATHEFCVRTGLHAIRRYVSACDVFERYLHGDVRGARAAAFLALGEASDANQRGNLAVVGPLVALDLDDAELLRLTASDDIVAPLREGARSQSLGLAAGGIAARLLAEGRVDDAAALLEHAVFALETTFGAQFVLPLAARLVAAPAARERLAELTGAVSNEDRAGLATRAMVDAVIALRERRDDRGELAAAAVERYAALEWPMLRAAALELAGEPAEARALYMSCGSVRQARRLTPGSKARSPGEAETPSARATFTAREREIAASVAAGYGNTEIATRLGLSVKTVESHLSRIYARLGFRSRAQLAAYITNERVASARRE